MTVGYDPEHGIIENALRLNSTVVYQVLRRPEFYFLFAFHASVSWLYKMGYFEPAAYDLELTMQMTGVTGALMTFFVVFYNGNVFERYLVLYSLTKQMCEDCLATIAYATRVVPCRHTQRKLCRMLLASAFLFFYECTSRGEASPAEGPRISASEWAHLETLGLINQYEIKLLEDHCRLLGANAIPSFMLLQWSLSLYRTQRPKGSRAPDLDKMYWRLRSRQDDVAQIMELPMPFQYFHIMNYLMMMNLIFWAYSFAVMDSVVATVIYAAIQLVFQGIRELTIAMADPFGEDDADFPLNEWVNNLYVRMLAVVEDEWDLSRATPLGEVPPMPQPEHGEMIVDLSIDEPLGSVQGPGGKVARAQHHTPEDTDGYALLPTNLPTYHRQLSSPSSDDEAFKCKGKCSCLRLQIGKWIRRGIAATPFRRRLQDKPAANQSEVAVR